MSKNWIFSRLPLLLMALVIALSITACGNANSGTGTTQSAATGTTASAASTTAVKEKPELYTIKYFDIQNVKFSKTSDESEIGKIIKDKFNIVLEYIPYSGDYREKLNLMLAAGDYPDMLRIEREDIVQKYLQAGALLPLDDYLSKSPNFTERYKDLIPYWRMSSPDKKLYKWEFWVPQSKEVNVQNYDMFVRTDALEKQGWPKLVSVDDYVKFLTQAMKDFPTTNGKKTIGMTVPFAEPWGIAGLAGVLYEKGDVYTASAGNMGVIWNYKDKKFEDYINNPYVKETLQFLNKLYQAGILDKESFTDHLDQVTQKVEAGQVLSGLYCTWTEASANQKLIAAGHPEMQYITLPIQTNSQVAQGQKRNMANEADRPFDSVVITKNAKHPERIFEMVDWAASEEGQILLQSGIEGKDYTIKDGKRVPTDTYINNMFKGQDPDYREKEGLKLFNWFGYVNTLAKDGVAYDFAVDPIYKDQYGLTDRQKQAFQALGWTSSVDWWIKNGTDAREALANSVSIAPDSDLGKLHAKITEYRTNEFTKVIMSKSDSEFEVKYAKMLEGYDKFDHQKIIDEYNRLYAETKAKLGQ